MKPRAALVFAALLSLPACDPEAFFSEGPPAPETPKPAWARASLRAYDGAPPVIPHRPIEGARCEVCHDKVGREIPGLGIAPASPHDETPGMSASRCRQCHVYVEARDVFVATTFPKWYTGTPAGSRPHAHAPPIAPHRAFMHEDCNTCHAGKAARAEIRTTHPERGRCASCHAFATTEGEFER